MQTESRQIFILLGFMSLLVTATLFVFVYAPQPVEPLSLTGEDIVGYADDFFTWVGDTLIDLLTD